MRISTAEHRTRAQFTARIHDAQPFPTVKQGKQVSLHPVQVQAAYIALSYPTPMGEVYQWRLMCVTVTGSPMRKDGRVGAATIDVTIPIDENREYLRDLPKQLMSWAQEQARYLPVAPPVGLPRRDLYPVAVGSPSGGGPTPRSQATGDE